jgi:CRP/FNR family nitrogen fixation transcriptional regulator
MLLRNNESGHRRPNSRELDALAGAGVVCSEFCYGRGREIFGESERAQYFYQIKCGAVRTCRLLADGRRQITAFYLPGDIFGIENGPAHRFTAEAIIRTTVQLTKRENVVPGDKNAVVTNNILKLVTRNLQHAESHLLLLGRQTSIEKVAAFLIEMDERSAAAGVICLPMSRRDIADYLGLALETVSRVMSLLRDENVLIFLDQSQRQIVLRDRTKLVKLASWVQSRDTVPM